MKYNKTFQLTRRKKVRKHGHVDVASVLSKCKTTIECLELLSKLQTMEGWFM